MKHITFTDVLVAIGCLVLMGACIAYLAQTGDECRERGGKQVCWSTIGGGLQCECFAKEMLR